MSQLMETKGFSSIANERQNLDIFHIFRIVNMLNLLSACMCGAMNLQNHFWHIILVKIIGTTT
jgi:hypothetical protein